MRNCLSRLALGALLTGTALLSATPAGADTVSNPSVLPVGAPSSGSSGGAGGAAPSTPGQATNIGASSASGSCSGSVDRSFQDRGYFYAHTWQWASPSFDGTVGSWEDHDFTFMGFLEPAEQARVLGARDGKWIIYRATDFDLAVPYVDGAGLFLLENTDHWGDRDSSYSDLDDYNGTFEWIKLCDY
ncbi:hypothetical protein [Nocardia sp. IFM 10818]